MLGDVAWWGGGTVRLQLLELSLEWDTESRAGEGATGRRWSGWWALSPGPTPLYWGRGRGGLGSSRVGSFQVEPFASLSEAVRSSVPRVLINREAVESWAWHPRSRDVVQLGDLVDSVERLVELLGWTEEMKDLVQRETAKVGCGAGSSRGWSLLLWSRLAEAGTAVLTVTVSPAPQLPGVVWVSGSGKVVLVTSVQH